MNSRLIKKYIFLTVFILVLSAGIYVNAAPNNTIFGDPKAIKGGQLNLCISEFPESFNYFTSNTTDTHEIFTLLYDTLMEYDPKTAEYLPLIAKAIDVSPDKKIFTVKVDPRAKWADGKPVTSEDIKFTYDTIMNPKNLTSVMRLYCGRFYPEIVDKYTIKFIAKTAHFKNLDTLATTMNILPKHLFQGKDFNKAFNMSLPPGSGPYILSEVKEGRYYTLTRRKNYWADQLPHHRGMYNFMKIKTKVINLNVAFEAFKKGDFDIMGINIAKRWYTELNVEPFQKNWIVKQRYFNYIPSGPYGLVFNMRKPIFKDLRVRKAIFNLFDRKTLIEKIMYNAYKPLNSYWPALYGKNEPSNPMVEYDPAKAKELLKEVGYSRLDNEGYLMNDKGERLEFSILYSGETFEKHLTFFVETCKQAGVKVNLELLSGAAFQKRQEEYKFDMALAAWSGDLFDDPEQLWHSKHIDEIGGSNLPGYKNPEVDRLIESLPPIFDLEKRNKILKEIDHLVYNDTPYILFWGSDYFRIAYKNIFGKPKTIFSKYTLYQPEYDIIAYWWIDPVKQKKYEQAVAKKKPLPGEPVDVYYDDLAK